MTFDGQVTIQPAAIIVSVSVALLLPGVESVNPPGAVMVAVLETEPVAEPLKVAVTVYVTDAPAGRLTPVSLILPVPEASFPVAPPAATDVQDTDVN